MKYQAVRCDFCGKEIQDYTHIKAIRILNSFLKGSYRKGFDICDPCMSDFRKFVMERIEPEERQK